MLRNIRSSIFLLTLFSFQTCCFCWLVDNGKTNECVELYKEADFKGVHHDFQIGKYVDLSSTRVSEDTAETWNNQTASFKLKQGCTTLVCSDYYHLGECASFDKDQSALYPVFHKNISSISCTCNNDCTISKCDKIRSNLRSSECGRAFIETGCNSCAGEYIGLLPTNVSYIGAYHEDIKSIVINTGCSLTAFKYKDFEEELTKIAAGSHDNWFGDIGSYECVCDNSVPRTDNGDQNLDAQSGYPLLVNVPSTVENVSAMIEQVGRHPGLLTALRSMKSKRSPRNAYILLLGMTGSGKSATINFLFDNAEIAKVGSSKSTTSNITEYRIPVPVEELGLGNSELRVIDTPGLGDTRGLEKDAQFLATLETYLDNHEDLKNRIPNIVLVFARFDENRFVGEGSTFVKTLRGIDLFRERLFDSRFSNVIIVLTHAMKAGRVTIKNPKKKLEEFRKAVEDYSLFPKPIVATLAENRPLDSDLPLINGYYRLPNGQLYPRNLFDRIQEACKYGDDPIGASIISTGFSHPEKFNVTAFDTTMVPINYGRATYFLGVLSARNYESVETEVSKLLQKGYEKVDPKYKTQFPDTLPYLQRVLYIRNIITPKDVPRTSAGIIKLLKEIRQTSAVISLLEKGLNIKVPTLEMNLLVGQGYDITKDTNLPTSPFKSKSVEASDIGYLLPDILTCKVQNEIANIFQTFGSKKAYYQARLRNLNVDDADASNDVFESDLKPGFNLLESERNLSSGISLTAVRERRLFQLILNDKAELNPEFITKVNDLPTFNASDYDNVEKWKNFFSLYGTHVIKAAHGGGAIDISLTADKYVANSSASITEELGETLFRLVQFAEDIYIGKRSNFNMAQTGITHTLGFRGGDYQYHTTDLFRHGISGAATLLTKWEESLILQPTILQSSMDLIPISEIVKRFSEPKSVEIATAAKALYNATLKYYPPPPSKLPPARNETWIAEIVSSYNLQISKILEEFQEERKENAKQLLKLQEDFREEGKRRDEATKKMMEASARQQEEQIKTIREESEKREQDNERRHLERLKIADAQIKEINRQNQVRADESKREHEARVAQANAQIELIKAENARRAEADRKAFELAQATSRAQIEALQRRSTDGGGRKCLKAGTKILMADWTELPVEKLQKGDFVLDKDLNPTLVTSVAKWFKGDNSFYGFDEKNQFFTETHSFVGENGKIFVVDKKGLLETNPLMEYFDLVEMQDTFKILKRVNNSNVVPVNVNLFSDKEGNYPEDTLVYFFQVESPSGTYIANSFVSRHEIPDFSKWPNTMNLLFRIAGSEVAAQLKEFEYTVENVQKFEMVGEVVAKELVNVVLSLPNTIQGIQIDELLNDTESLDTEIFDNINEILENQQISTFATTLYAKCSKALSEVLDKGIFESHNSMQNLRDIQNILFNTGIATLREYLEFLRRGVIF